MAYKNFIKVLGNGFLLVMFLLVADLFITAWFNPNQSITIYINLHKEIYFDLICLGLTAVFGIWALILNLLDWIKELWKK